MKSRRHIHHVSYAVVGAVLIWIGTGSFLTAAGIFLMFCVLAEMLWEATWMILKSR